MLTFRLPCLLRKKGFETQENHLPEGSGLALKDDGDPQNDQNHRPPASDETPEVEVHDA